MINALNSGADVFMADFEDSLSPTWANVVAGAGEPGGRRPPRPRVHEPRGEGLPAERRDRDASRAAARAGTCRRTTSRSTAQPISASLFDFGLYFFHNAPRAAVARHGSVLLPAEDGEPPRGAAVERRLPLRAGARSESRGAPSARRCLIETLPGGVRDGGDPLRAARARERPERRAAGTTSSPRSRRCGGGGTSSCPTGSS